MHLLKDRSACSQVEALEKLGHLGLPVAKSLFNNIMTGKGAGIKSLIAIAKGLQEIVRQELDMAWADGAFVAMNTEGFQPEIIPSGKEKDGGKGFVFHENGRLPIAEKTAFFKDAQHEVIEFGTMLNRFTNNLYKGGDTELRQPIAALLERGVNFKCFLIDHDCNEARIYFNDRETRQPGEALYAQKIKDNLAKLATIKAGFDQAGHPGSFGIFTYRHLPYNYFMAVDGGTRHCKMMVSPYLYGLPRNLAPVLEVSYAHSPELCRRYWDSFQALMDKARRV